MQLHRLKLVNFRQHADTEFEFGPGLTAVIGPNGAGKTTLLEAIAWSIYGNAAARGGRDSIRWNRAPARSPVKVELDFTLGAHEYRVCRGLNDAQLFQDRGTSPVSSGTTEVTGVLTRLLGMTREEFFNTYFTGQKELAVMASLGPADRGRFLSRVLGYEKLRTAQDAVRHMRGHIRGELAGLEAGLGDEQEVERERQQAADRLAAARSMVDKVASTLQQARQALAVEGPEWTRMAEVRQKVLGLDGDRRAAEHQVVDARREHERLDRELAEALTARARLDELAPQLAQVEPLRGELDRLESEGRGANERRALSGQLIEVESQIARLSARLEETANLADAIAAAEQALAGARARLREAEAAEARARAGWVQEKVHASTRREELLAQYEDIQKQRDRVVELGPEGLCPTCGRPLGKDFQQLVETFDGQLEKLKVNGQYFRSRMAQLETEPPEVTAAEQARAAAAATVQSLTQQVADTRAAVRERAEAEKEHAALGQRLAATRARIAALPERYDEQRHDEVRDRLRELEPLIRQRERYAVQADRAQTLVAEMETAEKRLTERETRARQLAEAIADLGYSEAAYLAVKERHERAVEAVRLAEVDLATQRGDLRAAEGALANAQRRAEERRQRAERIAALQADALLHEELDTALGEIRTDLNAQMRPELSDIASVMLSALTDGRYTELELDESYGIVLVDDGVQKPVLSGGEEDVANLALRLAISQLVAERAGQPVSLLVLDEIFGSLDEPRRASVVKLLQGIRDQFPQVLLITHIDSIRSYQVDRVLEVSVDQVKGTAVVTDA